MSDAKKDISVRLTELANSYRPVRLVEQNHRPGEYKLEVEVCVNDAEDLKEYLLNEIPGDTIIETTDGTMTIKQYADMVAEMVSTQALYGEFEHPVEDLARPQREKLPYVKPEIIPVENIHSCTGIKQSEKDDENT